MPFARPRDYEPPQPRVFPSNLSVVGNRNNTATATATNQNNILAIMAQRILFCPAEERTARELQQLPPTERERVWADMTGNQDTTYYQIHAEHPTFVEQCIQQLLQEIQQLVATPQLPPPPSPQIFTHTTNQQNSNSNTTTTNSSSSSSSAYALDLALRQNVPYVTNPKLLIAFLRADGFQISLAATRMAAFFQYKLKLFGIEKLTKNITLSDLDEDDIESLKSGGMQLLPLKDHAARSVIFTRQRDYKYKKRENMLRAFFYMAMSALESVQVQKLGVLSISYQVGGSYPQGGYDYELTRMVSALVKATPLRFVAVYVCFNDSPWKSVADFISHMVSPLLRLRLRTIQGSHQEVLYKLMAVGLPNRSIPVTHDGEALLYNHMQFLEARQKIEALRVQTNDLDCNMPFWGIIEGDPRNLTVPDNDHDTNMPLVGGTSSSSHGDRGQPSTSPVMIEDQPMED